MAVAIHWGPLDGRPKDSLKGVSGSFWVDQVLCGVKAWANSEKACKVS